MSTVANIFSGVEARVWSDGTSIGSSTEPSQSEFFQWMKETYDWLTAICAEMGSELGRTIGSITTVDGTGSYSDFASDMYAPYNFGWVLKTNERNRIDLCTEDELLERDPSAENEPDKFYVDGSNNVVLLDTPDDAYTVEIPYWQIQSLPTATTDTIPFLGLFDNVIIDSLVLKTQNRDEYDLGFELKWFQFIKERAERVIYLRKNPNASVGL